MSKNDLGMDIKYFQYSGYYDWPKLYKLIISWAKSEEMKVYEPQYKDKASKMGSEREIKWYFEKKVDQMHKYGLNVEIQMWDCVPVEITENGEKKKVERGRFRVGVSGFIDDDYQKLFEEKRWQRWKILRPLYNKIMQVQEGFTHWDDLHKKRYELLNEIKTFLDTETAE